MKLRSSDSRHCVRERRSRLSRRTAHAAIAAVFALVLFAPLTTTNALAANPETNRYRVHFSIGQQFDRFQSPAADSLGLSVTNGTTMAIDVDFRVLDVPMAGTERPAFRVFGRTATAKRTFATLAGSLPQFTEAPVEESEVLEMSGGFKLTVPMAMVDPGAGSELFVRYQAGLVLARQSPDDFMDVSLVSIGFERTTGFFDGSFVEVARGRNELYGRGAAAGRWIARFRVQGSLGPVGAHAAAPEVTGGETAAELSGSWMPPLRLFAEMAVDTDGRAGPDGIQASVGISVDVGHVLQRIAGTTY